MKYCYAPAEDKLLSFISNFREANKRKYYAIKVILFINNLS